MYKSIVKAGAIIATGTMLGIALLAIPAEAGATAKTVAASKTLLTTKGTTTKATVVKVAAAKVTPTPTAKSASKKTAKTTSKPMIKPTTTPVRWTWKVDGTTKTATTPSLNKSASGYEVSIVELAKMLGIPLKIDPITKTVYFGKLNEADTIVATYKVGNATKSLSETELYAYLNYISFYNPDYAEYKNNPTELENIAKEYMLFESISDKLTGIERSQANAKVDNLMVDLKKRIDSSEQYKARWSMLTISEATFKRFLAYRTLAIAYEKTRVDQALVDEEFVGANSDGSLMTADVRHILVQTMDPTSGQVVRSDEEALAKAKQLQDKLKAGASFADLAASDSDDGGSKTNGGLYANANINDWVTEFKEAAKTLPLNTLSEPVKTQYGYHLMIVEKRSMRAEADVKNEIKEYYASQQLYNRMQNGMSEILISYQTPKTYFK